MKKLITSILLLSSLLFAQPTCTVSEADGKYTVDIHKDGVHDVILHHDVPTPEVHKPVTAHTEKQDTFKTRVTWGKGISGHDENSSFVGVVRFEEVIDQAHLSAANPRRILGKTDENGTIAILLPANWNFRMQADAGDKDWYINYNILKMNGFGSQFEWVGKCDDKQIVTGDGVKTGWKRVHHDVYTLPTK